jgi:uncharacterized membrane protein YbjE (DUF340 family)
MSSSLLIIAFFAAGMLLSWAGWLPSLLADEELTVWLLYALMFTVGLSVGADKRLREILRTLRPSVLLVPLATTIGTFAGVALVSLVLRYSITECLAVGAGFGYYSLSSVFITQYKGAELGTVALLANILRELITLLGAGLMVRYCGKLAPVCAGGCTTTDTTLPVITRFAGKDMVFIAIVHAMVLDLSVPLWVLFFCSF